MDFISLIERGEIQDFSKKKKKSLQLTKEKRKEFMESGPENILYVNTTDDLQNELGPSIDDMIINEASFPITQEFKFGDIDNQVISMCVSKNGNYVCTGGASSDIRYYNMASMNATGKKVDVLIQLPEQIEVNSLSFNCREKLILAGFGNPIMYIYDRKGLRKGETTRGDMYLLDVTHTKGHTSLVTSAEFRPTHEGEFASTSYDGTLRFWNIERLSEQKMMYTLSSTGGVRNKGRGLCWAPDGSGVFVSADDSSVSFFSEKGETRDPTYKLLLNYEFGNGGYVTINENMLAVRSLSGLQAKVFDIRNVTNPIYETSCKTNVNNLEISPDCRFLLIPESVNRNSINGGRVTFHDMLSGTIVEELEFSSGVGCKSVKWNQSTNQIFVGCNDGYIRGFFDKRISRSGVINVLLSGTASRSESDNAVIGELIPHLVDPEVDRIIKGFWFPFTDENVRKMRQLRQPKAPQWGEGHHGEIATTPRHAMLKELNVIDYTDSSDIKQRLQRRDKDAEKLKITKVHHSDDE